MLVPGRPTHRYPLGRLVRIMMLFVLLMVMLLLRLVSAVTPSPHGHAASPDITGLHVQGNQIVNGAGQPLRLLGVDRSGAEFACMAAWSIFGSPTDAASVQAIVSWHVNAVRVPLNEDCWLGINGVAAAYSGAAYQQAIASYVSLLNQYGLVAILDLHWNAPGTQQAKGQQPMPDQDHAPAFWASVASYFKGNSAVIFDLYNEPYPDNMGDNAAAWTCWRDGGTCAGVPFQAAGMQELVNAVRATGATNVIMVGGTQWAGSLSHWLAYEPVDPLHNLAASWHSYNFSVCSTPACWDSNVAPVAAQVPVIAGEIGENDCAHGYIDTLTSWMDSHGASYLAWTWDTWSCSSGPALISDYSGTPTNFGIGFKQHLANLAAEGTPPTEAPTAPATSPTWTPTAPATSPTWTPTAPITTSPPTSGTFPMGINVGGPAYTAGDGTMYVADSTAYVSSATSTQVYTTGAAIGGTSDPTLFQTGRAGQNLAYTLSVPNGTYMVTVMIAPTSAAVLDDDGEDIYIQGQKVGYCYWSQDPACMSQQRPFANTAAQASFPASVTDGTLRLNVEGSFGGQAILSAIRVAQVGASSTAVSTSVAPVGTPTPPAATPTPVAPAAAANSVASTAPTTPSPGAPAMTGTSPAVMPLISLGAPAFASSNQAAAAQAADWLHTNSWRSTIVTYDGNGNPTGSLISPDNPVWVAYDLSAVPLAERQTDLAVIHSPQYEYDYSVIAGPLYDMPLTYALQINGAPGGGPPPTSGWQTVATVTNTLLHSHQHVFSMGGANWVRVDVTGAGNQNWNDDAQLALDVYDASGGTDDDFIIFGDSITANAMNWGTISNSAGTVTDQELGVLLHDQVPAHYPAYEAGGIPYLTAGSALTSIDRWLALFPGKFVGLAYGTNDADGCVAPATFYNNYARLVQKVLAAGKIPMVPYFPWNSAFTPACGQALHDQITALYQVYPQIIHGPDLWTYFKTHPNQIENYPSPGIHPNADGNMALREMWRNTLLQAIYHVTPGPGVLSTSTG